jgi:hypothetical protein
MDPAPFLDDVDDVPEINPGNDPDDEEARSRATEIQNLTDQLNALLAEQGRSTTERTTRFSPPDNRSASTFSELIGDFLPVERTEIELEHSSMQVISRADRDRLSASDKNKVYQAFAKGITSKFKATSTVVGLDDVSTIDNIISFAQLRLELQRHITSISAHSVFLILKFDNTNHLIDPDSFAGKPIQPSLDQRLTSHITG